MDGYEDTRRKFLKKLGLTFGVTMVASSAFSAVVTEKKEDFRLTSEQEYFMVHYEKWMDEFIDVIAIQRITPEDIDNNKNLVRLTVMAKEWQPKLTGFMKDENFARHYMIATERMTNEIK